MYQETSRFGYDVVQPEINKLQRQVFDALQMKGQASNMEIADHLGWSVNRVTPRMLELRLKGLVKLATHRKCHVTGNTCIAWRPNLV